ncbi:DsbA family protein [Cohaesibacter celericrescens]|uniref:Disulfide bond formation protein DsbA n=1 Tax=Cohaesibacter celericrescens TaxID=2067669 RepID=A0A2N5XSE5_9HYPH|nr:DsbA family protein [Cohaesibacter celericrescens]PLW77432.1 disulfide bond formation protein DsbA [Cohaesibacter celericrescens]
MRKPMHMIAFLMFVITSIGFVSAPAIAANFDADQKEEIEKIVTDYLLENPDLMRQVFGVLRQQDAEREKQAQNERSERAKEALLANKDALFNAKEDVVLGNPDGDVTLVEFLDYNCGYCKQAFGNMLELLDSDKNLRFIVKEWPVLGPQSMEAALVAVAITKEAPEKYLDFHKAMMTLRGTASKESALRVAEKIGISRAKLEALYEDRTLVKTIEENYKMADALQLTGTPGYVLADEVIPGFVPVDTLKTKIKDIRSCGSTSC